MVRSIVGLFISIAFSFLFISAVAAESTLSVFPPMILFAVAVLFTWRMGVTGLIKNPDVLINALSLKVVFSALIYFIFWYRPLKSIGILTISSQSDNLGFQDSMFYQYHANIISKIDIEYWLDASRVTWQSEGVVIYLASLFKLFGNELYNVVFINILLGYLAVVQLFQLGLSVKDKHFYLIVLWPHTLYYDIPPGKEVLTNFLVYSIICCGYRIFIKTGRVYFGDLIKLFFLFNLLVFVRVNVGVLLAIAIIISVWFSSRRTVILGALFALMGFVIYYRFTDNISLSVEASLDGAGNFDERLELEDNSLKVAIVNALHTNSTAINLFLSPVSFIIWILAPLPFIGLDVIYNSVVLGISYAQFTLGPHLGRLFASIWIFSNIFKFGIWTFFKNSWKTNFNHRYIIILTIFLSLTIAYSTLVQGARYRVLVEPLIVLLMVAASCDKVSDADSSSFPLR